MQSHEPCPDLLLHPVHGNGDHKPVIETQVAQFFTHTRRGISTAARQQAILSYPENLKRLNFELDPLCPRLSTDDGMVSISLHLPRSQLGFDRQSGLPLLTLEALGGSNRVWAILIIADVPHARRVMDALGKLGVIRSDFCKLYELQENLFVQGKYGPIYAITSYKEEGQDECQIVGKVAKMLMRSNPKSSSSAPTAHEQILREASVLAVVQGHPNVVRLHALFEVVDVSAPRWILSMEWFLGGDMRNVADNGPFSEHHAQQTMRGLASALSHIHTRGVAHLDVKPANILLASDGRPVLANFGLAVHVSAKGNMARQGGTLGYMAPEVLASLPYGCKADCFSAGCVLHFLISGTGPYTESDEAAEVLFGILHGTVTFEDASFSSTSGTCKDLIMRLLQTDAEDRLAMDKALVHPWLAQQSDCAAQQSDGKGLRKRGERFWNAVSSLPGSVAAAKDRIWSGGRAREERQSVGDQHGDGSTTSSGTQPSGREGEAVAGARARRSLWRLLTGGARSWRAGGGGGGGSAAEGFQDLRSLGSFEHPKMTLLHSGSSQVQDAQRSSTTALASILPAESVQAEAVSKDKSRPASAAFQRLIGLRAQPYTRKARSAWVLDGTADELTVDVR